MAETLFDHSTMGTPSAVGDDGPVTLGTIFRVLEKGYITQLYFYKDTTDTEDSHTVLLYDYTGAVLASQTTSGDSAKSAGWIAVPLDDAVVVDAGMEYMTATYYPSVYNVTAAYLTADMSNGQHLLVPNDANLLYFSTENGQFSYGTEPTFPIEAGHESYYWTDVEYVKDLIAPLDISSGVPTVGVPTITIGGLITISPSDLTANSYYFSIPSIASGTYEFTDDFTGTSGNLESSDDWTSDGVITGAFQYDTNNIKCTTSDEAGSAYFSPDLGRYDNFVNYTVIDQGSDSSGSFVCTRLSDNKHWLGVRHDPLTMRVEVYFRNGDTFDTNYRLYLSDADNEVTLGDTISLQVQDNFWIVSKGLDMLGSGIIPQAMPKTTRQGMVARQTVSNPYITTYTASVITSTATSVITEGDDTVSSEAEQYNQGVVSVTEGDDTLSTTGYFGAQADVNITEDNDTVVSESTLLITASVSITEENDTLNGLTQRVTSATASITEGDDTLHALVYRRPYRITVGTTNTLPYRKDY